MSDNRLDSFEESDGSTDDGRFIRVQSLVNTDAPEPERLTLTDFLDDLKDSLEDQDTLALMAVERDNISSKSMNVHVKGVTSFEQTAADRVLVQRQIFNDVLKWKPLTAIQTRADVVLNFSEDAPTTRPSFEPPKPLKRKDYEQKLSKRSADIAKELCNDNVDTALKKARLMPVDDDDDESIRLEQEKEDQLLDIMTQQQEVQRSSAEIARLRSLLYYNDQKLKAWAKIKSKKFRRVHNRDKRLARLAKKQEEQKRNSRSAVIEQAEDYLDTQYRLSTTSLDTFKHQLSKNAKVDNDLETHKMDVDDIPDYGEAPIDKNAKGVMRLAFMTRALQEQKEARDLLANTRDSDWERDSDDLHDNDLPISTSINQQPIKDQGKKPSSDKLRSYFDEKVDDEKNDNDLAGKASIARRTESANTQKEKVAGKVIIKGSSLSNKSATVINNPFLQKFSAEAQSPTPSTLFASNVRLTSQEEGILPEIPKPNSAFVSAFVADIDPNVDFAAQKYNLALQESQPNAQNDELMGWGTWFGEGMSANDMEKITFKRAAQRAAATAELNRRMGRRKDIKIANVMISEASNPAIIEMYAAHGIQGITNEEYANYLSTAVGPEWQSMTGYRGSIQAGRRIEKGRMILPAQLPQDFRKQMDLNLEKEDRLKKQLEAQMQLIHKTKLTQQRRQLKI